ncbi:CAMK family protein kinase [Tritrichomonas foetus]|uniref:CAMK family protein kinase n=1 Tax=Tritrichomonas foetus TaxID=1144522 RepID=A0A1J4J828_9EUKA|nr:CAMK family protein kinase [Tritrichomonas foetus]|eukprot:OHS95350.1 CAMK family protein kinase [Tritrichomonas foetus]
MSTAATNNTNVVRSSSLPFVLNGYNFLTLIGKGGFAEVFLVINMKYNKQFVAKVMTYDESKIDTFESEVQALCKLNHPNIIRIYDHFKINSQIFMILEFCSKGSLHNELTITKGLSYKRFLELSKEIVSALVYCHSKGIAHRDIKPGNVLIDDFYHTKLADFGLSLSNLLDGKLQTKFGGSYEYTAPEIFQKKPHDPKAGDVWALGVMFATMVTGVIPWKADSLGELKERVAKGKLTFAKQLPSKLEDLVRKMVVVDPKARLTMEEVAKHPVFSDYVSVIRPISQPKKILWDQISRKSDQVDESCDIMPENIFEMPTDVNVMTSVRAVQTAFLHGNIKQNKMISNRFYKRKSSDLTFIDFPDEVKEVM